MKEEFGDVISFPYGRNSYILLSDPEGIDQVLVLEAQDFPRGAPYKSWARERKTSGYNALGPYSEKDRFLTTRRSLQKSFSPNRSSGLWDWFSASAQELLITGASEDIDLSEHLRYGAQEMTIEASVGKIAASSSQMGAWYRDAYFFLLKSPSKKFRVFDYLRIPSKLKAFEATDSLAKTIAQGIKSGDPSQEALLDQLHKLVAAGEITHEEAMWQAVSVLMTINHGNLGAISWTLWRLAKNPEALKKLREELDRSKGSKGLTNLPYLEAVVNESFRQHPTIIGITREVTKECVVSGVPLKKGDVIEICPYLLSNDSRWWNEVDKFIPERWLDKRDAPQPKHVFIPFGVGMRKCIAYPMVMSMVGACVASLVGKYDFEILSDPASPFDSIPQGLRVNILPRSLEEAKS